MSVTASALIPIGTAPNAEETWALAYLLPVDWADEVVTTTAFSTDVGAAKSESEHRRGHLGRPIHGIRITLRGLDLMISAAIQSLIIRCAQSRSLCPMYSDESPLALPAASADTTIHLQTTYRRFYIGQRIAIKDNTKFVVKTVTGKGSNNLDLDSPVGADFASDSLVYPLIEAKLILETKGALLSDSCNELIIDALETPGPWCLDPIAVPGTIPSGVSTYNDIPIFNVPIDWSTNPTFNIKRTGSFSTSGIAQVATVYGSRARVGHTLPMMFIDRFYFWQLATFFDCRGGRLHSFWTASPSSDYSFVAFTVDGIKVKANGPEYDWIFRPYIAVVDADNNIQIRTVLSHSRSGTEDTLVLDAAFIPPAVMDRVCVARLVRFDSDEMQETWLSNGVCRVELPIIELLKEQTITIADLNDPFLAPLQGHFIPNTDGAESGIPAPMYYYPCGAVTERPAGRSADLLMPLKMGIRIQPGCTVDPSFVVLSGTIGTNLLASLPGSYDLEYIGTINGTSHHWNHITCCEPFSTVIFCFTPPTVTRHRWRATKIYLDNSGDEQTITVDFQAEWIADRSLQAGAWGALFNIYVYSSEVNPSYVDGTSFNGGTSFTVNDPAKWVGSAKLCHPRMLLCASIPTSWYASCGNQGGLGCNDPDTSFNDGYSGCNGQINTAPWLATADATKALGNVAFAGAPSVVDYAAMSLGGSCPTSELFEFLILENRLALGITALAPARSGWNETTGDINVTGGSGMTLSACMPSQLGDGIDCCFSHPTFPFAGDGGNPDCWRGPPSSPPACTGDIVLPDRQAVCCFPMTSTVSLVVHQRCICTTLDGDCNRISVCAEESRTFLLTVCSAIFFGGDARRMEWGLNVPDPGATFYNINEPFTVSTITWTPIFGNSWVFTGGFAEAQQDLGTPNPFFNCAAFTPFATYDDVDIEVDILNSAPSGVIIRTDGSADLPGYIFLYNPATKVLGIYKCTNPGGGPVKTTLSEVNLPPEFVLPLRLHISAKGGSLIVKPNNSSAYAAATYDCTDPITSTGYIGMVGVAGATHCKWDNFKAFDNNSQNFVRVQAWYDVNGWNVTVPPEAMPLYSQTLDGGTCVSDDTTARAVSPAFISAISSSNPASNYLGGGKPYPGNGGPGCGEGIGQCPPYVVGSSPLQHLVPYADWKAFSLTVSEICGTCPDGGHNWCKGFEWYSNAGCTSSA